MLTAGAAIDVMLRHVHNTFKVFLNYHGNCRHWNIQINDGMFVRPAESAGDMFGELGLMAMNAASCCACGPAGGAILRAPPRAR